MAFFLPKQVYVRGIMLEEMGCDSMPYTGGTTSNDEDLEVQLNICRTLRIVDGPYLAIQVGDILVRIEFVASDEMSHCIEIFESPSPGETFLHPGNAP